MRVFILWILALGLVGGSRLWAQPLPRPLDQYHVRVFTPADGLPAGDARYLAQLPDGHLYVSTARGVVRFDGYAFRTVPLPGFESQVIEAAHADRVGRLWLLTKENELGYIENGRFHRMPLVRALGTNSSNSIFETSDGLLWLNGTRGLVRIRPDDESPYTLFTTEHGLPSNSVYRVSDGPDGRTQVLTTNGIAFLVTDSTRSGTLRVESFVPPGVSPYGEHRYDIWANPQGIWLAFDDHVRRYPVRQDDDPPSPTTSFIRYDSSRPLHVDRLGLRPGRLSTLPSSLSAHLRFEGEGAHCKPLRAHQSCRLLPTLDGTHWITFVYADTLLRVQGSQVAPISLHEHLDFTAINRTAIDHEGSLWLGTDRGVIQLAPRVVSAMTERSGLKETFTVSVLQTRDEALWVGTWGGGLHRFADGRLTHHYTQDDGLPDNRIRSLYEASDGTLWIGTKQGTAALRRGRIETRMSGIGEVRDFAEMTDGALWIGSATRLLARRPDGSLVDPDSTFWSDKQIWALHAARDGSLWIGSENGLFRYVDENLHTYGTVDGLRSPFVVSIHEEDDGTLWFSTYEDGLHRYRDGRFVVVTTREGLHHNGVWRMLWDDRGGIWMSSDQGIFRVEHDRLHAVADAVKHGRRPNEPLDPLVFSESEGMPSRECNRASPGGWRLADGRFVFNNLQGLVLINPERALAPPPPPRTTLHRVVADGTPIERAPGSETIVPAGTKQLRFHFAALSFIAPGQNHYRYRMDGYDETWIDGGMRSMAAYTNLPPGEYAFRVQSASGMSAWGESTAAAFTLRPLLWQTWWFQGLAAGLLIALLTAAYQYRVRRLLEMERLRLRLASDLHDEVGSNVSSIALISEMLTERLRDDELEQRQLHRIHAAAEDTVRALRDIIWLVDPKHDTLADLLRKMQRIAPTLLNGTPYTMDTQVPREPRPLDLHFVRNVFLIYKEALHNVAKHSDAQHVTIRVTAHRGRFTLRVRDDGTGFDAGAVNRGHGLDSLRRRAEAVRGKIEIDSAPGHGTEIAFTAKMA